MQRVNYKSIALTIFIISLIVLLLVFNYFYFLKSPGMLEVEKVETITTLFESKYQKDVDFESRYMLDKVYYAATDEAFLYVYDENGNLLETTDRSAINNALALELLKLDKETHVGYALFDGELVYAITTEKVEYLVNVERLEIVLKMDKVIGND